MQSSGMAPYSPIKRRLLQGGLALTVGLVLLGWSGRRFQSQVRAAWEHDQFSPEVRALWLAVARAVLSQVLPSAPSERAEHEERFLTQLAALLQQLPYHTQKELRLLLAGLCTYPVRRALIGLASPWQEASEAEVGAALQAMRLSNHGLKVQAYQALQSLTCAAYFSSPAHWAALGYPGPMTI